MTAIITTQFTPDYTANFAFLSNLITRFKPNKIISTTQPSLGYGDSLNLLKNRTITKPPIVKVAPRKEARKVITSQVKTTPQKYSLRSKELDTLEGKKKITLANENLRRSAADLDSETIPTGYKKYQPILGNQFQNYTLGKKIYKNKEEVTKIVKDNEKAWKQTQNRGFKPKTINVPPLIRNNKRQVQNKALIPYQAR